MLYDPIFQRMKGDDGKSSTRSQQFDCLRQNRFDTTKFVVDGYPQRLEGAGGRMYAFMAFPYRLLNDLSELHGCAEWSGCQYCHERSGVAFCSSPNSQRMCNNSSSERPFTRSAAVIPPIGLKRMSNGASVRKENPFSGLSNCMEENQDRGESHPPCSIPGMSACTRISR